MTKNDIGAALAGLLSVLSAFAVGAREYLGRWLAKAGTSIMAVVASPAVWLACGLVFVGGFWLGHIGGAAGKKALRADVVALKLEYDRRGRTLKERAKEIDALTEATEKLTAEVASLKSGHAAPKSEPVAAVSRPRVAKAAQTKPAASEAPKVPFWSPFQN